MTKEQLEAKLKNNLTCVKVAQADLDLYSREVAEIEEKLKDIDKPKLTANQLGEIEMAIDNTVEHFDFDDIDSYSTEFEFDYDNRVVLQDINFDNKSELIREVVEAVWELFANVEDEDCDNS